MAISTMVMAMTLLRPSLSPSGPQTIPPSGRSKKEIAYPSMVNAVPRVGKNACVRKVVVAA
ncbi:Uncharacterised protein [Mycobacteroides abscessus subsp. massiliense]|nr:Uncharacterised protein [Mycobacteroides abscessus subsp. massiliense]